MQRRLTTILAADVVGYSAKVGVSEAETLAQLSSLAELMDEQVARGGRAHLCPCGRWLPVRAPKSRIRRSDSV